MSTGIIPQAQNLSEGPGSLWGNRDYMLLWSGQAISTLGSQVSQFASPLLVLLLTGSPGMAGLIASLVAFPIIFLALPAGALIDRWDRKRVMIICDCCRFVALGSIPIVYAFGHLTIIQLVVAGLIEGSSFAFFTLAEISCLPRVVPQKQVTTAYSLNGLATSTASMVGPVLSGWLFTLGRTLPFIFDATSYGISVVSLIFIKKTFQEERTPVPFTLRIIIKEIGEGIHWLWKRPILRFLLVGAFVGNAAVNGLILVLIYEGTHLHIPSYGTGILLALYGAGAIVGSALAAPLGKVRFDRLLLTWQWLAPGVLLLLLLVPPLIQFQGGMVHLIALSILVGGPFIYYGGESAIGIITVSYRVSLIPDELRGRVNGVYRLVAFAGPSAGLALSGLLLQVGGLPLVMYVFVPALVAVAILYTFSPSIRHSLRSRVSTDSTDESR